MFFLKQETRRKRLNKKGINFNLQNNLTRPLIRKIITREGLKVPVKSAEEAAQEKLKQLRTTNPSHQVNQDRARTRFRTYRMTNNIYLFHNYYTLQVLGKWHRFFLGESKNPIFPNIIIGTVFLSCSQRKRRRHFSPIAQRFLHTGDT